MAGNHMSMDPFAEHFPVWTPEFQSMLRGMELAIKQQNAVQRSVDTSWNLKRVIGGTGQGQGKERKDKPTGAERESVKAPNHYAAFCTHEIPYWRPCKKCGRDKAAAAKNINIVLKSINGAAFHTK